MKQLRWLDPVFVLLIWVAMVVSPTLPLMLLSIVIIVLLYDVIRYLTNKTQPFLSIFLTVLIGLQVLLTQGLGINLREGFLDGRLFPDLMILAYLIAALIGSRWPRHEDGECQIAASEE